MHGCRRRGEITFHPASLVVARQPIPSSPTRLTRSRTPARPVSGILRDVSCPSANSVHRCSVYTAGGCGRRQRTPSGRWPETDDCLPTRGVVHSGDAGGGRLGQSGAPGFHRSTITFMFSPAPSFVAPMGDTGVLRGRQVRTIGSPRLRSRARCRPRGRSWSEAVVTPG